MDSFIAYAAVFFVGELVAVITFMIMRKTVANAPAWKCPDLATLKGVLERLVLYVGLLKGYSTVLVVFGALKLGTRLHDEEGSRKISNDYFLLGNFTSILIAMLDTIVVDGFLA